jgi:hypothetical protein
MVKATELSCEKIQRTGYRRINVGPRTRQDELADHLQGIARCIEKLFSSVTGPKDGRY